MFRHRSRTPRLDAEVADIAHRRQKYTDRPDTIALRAR